MYIYKISQEINDDYDTYDSAIVVAHSAIDAAKIHPDGHRELGRCRGVWVGLKDADKIKVELIGDACENQERGVIVASFNAG